MTVNVEAAVGHFVRAFGSDGNILSKLVFSKRDGGIVFSADRLDRNSGSFYFSFFSARFTALAI